MSRESVQMRRTSPDSTSIHHQELKIQATKQMAKRMHPENTARAPPYLSSAPYASFIFMNPPTMSTTARAVSNFNMCVSLATRTCSTEQIDVLNPVDLGIFFLFLLAQCVGSRELLLVELDDTASAATQCEVV